MWMTMRDKTEKLEHVLVLHIAQGSKRKQATYVQLH